MRHGLKIAGVALVLLGGRRGVVPGQIGRDAVPEAALAYLRGLDR